MGWEMQRLTGEVHHHNVVIVERISNMDREGRGTDRVGRCRLVT